MIIYLLCFAVSVVFAYFASKTEDHKRFLVFSVLSILVTAILAGLRDYNVGIDTQNYYTLKRFWVSASGSESFKEYMTYYLSLGYGEVFFAALMGLIGQLTGSYSIFLFVVHLVIVSGVYIGIFRHRKHIEPAFVLLLFYLLFYNYTLNVMRQSMALAIIFGALADLEQGKKWRYLICVGIAMMFHNTAILGLGALMVHWALYADPSKVIPTFRPSMRMRKTIIIVGLCLVVFCLPTVSRILVDSGILLKKYNFFLTNPEKIQPTTMISMYIVVELFVVFLLRKQMGERSSSFEYLSICSVCYLIMHQLSRTVVYGKRFAMYLAFGNMLTIGLIQSSFKTEKWKKYSALAITAIALFYWWYSYILRNASQTYPYQFVF